MTRALAVILSAALATNCAAAAYQRGPTAAPGPQPVVTSEYLRAMPVGTLVKVQLTDGETVRGDLMLVRDAEIVIQPRTRIHVPPRTIALERVVGVEIQRENNMARAIAVGAAVGAAAAISVFLALLAAFAD